jgi:glycosyltransferase involved in cell wall biosynthesis
MMGELVSVIIPTYNRPKFLERAIKSVLEQSYKDIEVIIVDDNANNLEIQKESKAIIENFTEYPNVKYIQNKINLGGAEARNTGVRHALGKYISFLDDDDTYERNKISEQLKTLENKKSFDVCYCGMKYLDEENKNIGHRRIYLEGAEELISKHIFRPITGTPTLLMKKSVFEQINGFDNLKRYQDANLIFKLLANKLNITYVKKDLVNVYIHEEERISTNGKWIEAEKLYIENTLKYLDKLTTKNSKRLMDKYYIVTSFSENEKITSILVDIIKKVKLRVLIFSNLAGVINYLIKR